MQNFDFSNLIAREIYFKIQKRSLYSSRIFLKLNIFIFILWLKIKCKKHNYIKKFYNYKVYRILRFQDLKIYVEFQVRLLSSSKIKFTNYFYIYFIIKIIKKIYRISIFKIYLKIKKIIFLKNCFEIWNFRFLLLYFSNLNGYIIIGI